MKNSNSEFKLSSNLNSQDPNSYYLTEEKQSEDENLRHDFKDQGFLTRDSRKREREKYGHAGARKRFQFSKR